MDKKETQPTTKEDKAKSGSKTRARAPRRRGRRSDDDREKEEFEQKIIDLARVTRVMAGGKRMSFRACVALGDKNGRVGIGVAKGKDVTIAINKAVSQAKKKMISFSLVNEGTIPHQISSKFGAAKILLKPAPKGTGIIAGGVVRIVLDLAGVHNISGKIIGSKNKINNVKATIKALDSLKQVSR
ncbi:MAG TPA: 30S ribosomal protein S5 [Patescibacteria group bacterium]